MKRLCSLIIVMLAYAAVTPDATFAAEGGKDPWPYSMDMPASIQAKIDAKRKKKQTPILAWVPKDAKKIRGMLLIVANTDSKHFAEYEKTRAVAAKHGMAIIYFRYALQSDLDNVPKILAHVAKQVGHEEIAHAPWVTFGKSSMGKFPYYMAWKYPGRTVATISYHAETPKWPMADWSNIEDQTILHCSANGELEWGGTFAKHVRPSLLNYRLHTNVLPHQIVAHGVGHGDYVDAHGSKGWGKSHPGKTSVRDVWNYLALFVDKAMELRVPADAYATNAPIKLKKVDPSTGYLIEPFAVEDTFGRPRMDLVCDKDGYVVDPHADRPKLNGYVEIAPAKDYQPADGVPVVSFEVPMSPTKWLLTKNLPWAMKTDPMVDVSAFKDLRPKPDDTIKIDGKTATFTPIADKEIGRREKGNPRGLTMKHGLQPKNKQITVIGYTVLKVDEARTVKIVGYHSMAVRLQIVLNGVPVDHNQVVAMRPGLYPMLFALRMHSVTWGHVEPGFAKATEKEVAAAKATQADKEAKEKAFRKRFADGAPKPMSYLHPAKDVAADRRRHMLWIADRELAEAWVKLHNVKSR
ncbi:MAG: hypothetical protein ACOCXY_00910 [Planctomycetota bacterium]